mmetsp:Transcript_22640/g.38841  ORF Transcript_22640/g.38841 Transcript_22640/m.38841 type:complete len:209 (+) Transcript_22640:151-777(+)
MVIGQGQIHHGPDHNGVVDDHRTLVDGVHAQDGRLGGVDNRGGEEGAEHPPVGDGEGAAGHVVDGELVVLRLLPQIKDALLYVGEGEGVAVAEDGYDEAAGRGHRHRDVHIVTVNDVVAVDDCVDIGEVLKRDGGGLDEGGHESELDIVLLQEVVLVLVAELHQVRHVNFVEGREDGRGVLGVLQPLRDTSAQARHRNPAFPGVGPQC